MPFTFINNIQILIIAFFFIACNIDNGHTNSKMVPAKTNQYDSIKSDTSFVIEKVLVDVKVPAGKPLGFLIMLPGWNFSRTDCCEKSDFCKKALEKKLMLIMPEMGKSVYSEKLFKETRNDWRKYPTRAWIIDNMIPFFQNKYGILIKNGPNYLYGISTGARGVALLAMYADDIFKGGAALSGDYNQSQLKGDNLITGYYGSYDIYQSRWDGPDNAQKNCSKLKIPLFLAHGKKDKVVPCSQTENFFKEIKKTSPALSCIVKINDDAGHDYKFWDSVTDEVLEFLVRLK